MFLGLMKILFALLSGSAASTILENYPHAILGVLLFFSGLGLSKAGVVHLLRSRNDDDDDISELIIILSTASATVALKTGWGCFFGVCFSFFYGGFDHVFKDLEKRKNLWWNSKSSVTSSSSSSSSSLELPHHCEKDDDDNKSKCPTKGENLNDH